MSRRIEIKSELIEEIDLVEEVLNEINARSLSFDEKQKCFVNQQYDDIADNTIKKAEQLYYEKRRQRNIEKVKEALEKQGYRSTIKDENNKTKIVGVQLVYA